MSMKKDKKPAHWPDNVIYITANVCHSSVPPIIRSLVLSTTKSVSSVKIQPPMAIIRTITSTSHPACGQCGLFAKTKIPPRTQIIEYIGEIHCDDRSSSDYDLSLYRAQDGTNVGIDANHMGNEARFVNDYRGIRDKPNALFVDTEDDRGKHMSVWSGTDIIRKGDEILVSYGKSWWAARAEARTQTDGGGAPQT